MSPSFHILYNSIFNNLPRECFFTFSPSTEVLLHVKPASNGTFPDGCAAQGIGMTGTGNSGPLKLLLSEMRMSKILLSLCTTLSRREGGGMAATII